jgi:hypothetical protein
MPTAEVQAFDAYHRYADAIGRRSPMQAQQDRYRVLREIVHARIARGESPRQYVDAAAATLDKIDTLT